MRLTAITRRSVPTWAFLSLLVLYTVAMVIVFNSQHVTEEYTEIWDHNVRERAFTDRDSRPAAMVVEPTRPSVNVVPSKPNSDLKLAHHDCVPLPGSPKPGVVICIHPVADDVYISGHLKRGTLWEAGNIYEMQQVLQKDPTLQLVDLGANLGEYTIWAAAMGKHVLAVEMLKTNVELLQTSLHLSDLSAMVTIVNNAVYRDHRQIRANIMAKNLDGSHVESLEAGLKNETITSENNTQSTTKSQLGRDQPGYSDSGKGEIRAQVGGTIPASKEQSELNSNRPPFNNNISDPQETLTVDTICLNDLIPLLKQKSIYMKMDIEKSEHHALACADEFFKSVDVKYVQMEWLDRDEEERSIIVDFMTKYKFVASTRIGFLNSPGDLKKIKTVPSHDVFFVHQKNDISENRGR